VIGPVPRQFKGPQKCDYLFQTSGICKDQIRVPEHLQKHNKEKGQKSVAEPFAFHPFGNVFFSGQSKGTSQQSKQLSPAAIAVAVSFVSFCQRDDQRDEKAK